MERHMRGHLSETKRKKNLLYLTSNIFIMQVDEKRWLLFDVTMGAYDGAEVRELVETLKNKKELTKNIQGLWFRNSGRI